MAGSRSVAIVGAGLSGLALALALHKKGIKSTVYESRPAPLNIGGAVMLSPNGLRVLDRLDLYTAVRDRGFNFESSEFRNPDGKVIDTLAFGDERKHGYKANRIYRYELIEIMLDAVNVAGEGSIQVAYGQKFSHVVDESDLGVTFEFTSGIRATAGILIGADGIHSSVRKYLYPDDPTKHTPKFVGFAGISASVPASSLPSGVSIDVPVTIMSPHSGAFVVAPQKRDGSELFIGKQMRVAGDPSRAGWDAMHADKAASRAVLQRDNDPFGPVATAVTRAIDLDRINVWPFFVVPKLDDWASPARRVVLVGDAAHAIPPSAGQGISQAMEDVWMLALLVGHVFGTDHDDRSSTGGREGATATTVTNKSMHDALGFWHRFRQDRVAQILRLNARIDQRRVPRLAGQQPQAQPQQEEEEEKWDLSWLYDVDLDRVVEDWIADRKDG